MAQVLYTGESSALRAKLLRLGPILSGKEPDIGGIGEQVSTALGMWFLAEIRIDYIRKSDGVQGEIGGTWKPLSRMTIENRRQGHKFLAAEKAFNEREAIVRAEQQRIFERLAMSIPKNEAMARSKVLAEEYATQKTRTTYVESRSAMKIQILRDTGVLLNSLSPGQVTSDGRYVVQVVPGSDKQIFEPVAGKVTVGTNVAYAADHQDGVPSRRLPARPFFPRKGEQIPERWWERAHDAVNMALEAALKRWLQSGGANA